VGETEFVVDRAVLPDAVLARARVACRDGCIAAIDARPGGAFARRLRGTLLPGFVDLQVNGGGGRSCDEARPDALAAVAAASGAGGAVAFLPTLITAPWERLLAQVDAVARWIAGGGAGADAGGAEPLGLHVEGPFLTNPGAHDASCFVDPEPARVRELIDAARGTLRLLTLACDRRGAPAAVTQLRAAGVAVAIGHARSSDGFAACIGAGARMVTHLFNAMGSLHHREPGVAGLALDDERVHAGIIADGAHVHPAMVRNAFALLGADRTVLVSDAAPAAGMPDGDFTLGGRAVHAQAGVVRDAQGRLAGSALTMAAAARNFLAFVPRAGVWTLARVAAGNAAHVIGAAGFGAIAVGRRAAFTLLGDDGVAIALRG
jgi:N-acetylglucosamine-6-phosphate deacetylase